MPGSPCRIALLALAALAPAACASGANPVRDAFQAVGVGPKEVRAPDFVAQSRTERKDYVPVGTSAPARPIPKKTAAEVSRAEAEMDGARAANAARAAEAQAAGATPPPAPARPPAAAPSSR